MTAEELHGMQLLQTQTEDVPSGSASSVLRWCKLKISVTENVYGK